MIKSDVILYGMRPEMAIVYAIAKSVFEKHGYGCVITSAVGKKHGDKSLHPPGFAHDYRSKHINELQMKYQILSELKQALPQCDILLEYVDKPEEHYHCEFDPKNDERFQQDKEEYKLTGQWPGDIHG